jgi:hypothetical protein
MALKCWPKAITPMLSNVRRLNSSHISTTHKEKISVATTTGGASTCAPGINIRCCLESAYFLHLFKRAAVLSIIPERIVRTYDG